MEIVKILLIVIEVICALLLIGVILLQKSKNEGLGLAFGSGMGESLFGSRAGNVLTKITVVLAVVFMVTTTLLAAIYTSAHEQSIIDSRTAPLPVAPPSPPPSAQQPAAAAPQGGAPVPTLMPGASLEDMGATPAPAPAPAPAAAPLTVTLPEPAEGQP